MDNKNVIWGLVRAVIAAGAGALATKGLVEVSAVEPIVGAVMLLITMGWSAVSKKV